MIGLIVGFVVVGVVVAVAVMLVLAEVRRLRVDPPEPIFDEDEVFQWVVEHLPDIVAATLTADDVARILDFQVEFFRRRGVSVEADSVDADSVGANTALGSSESGAGPVVVGGSEIVDDIVARCAATGEAYLPEQVAGVIETQAGYLRAIGAIGAEARADNDI